VVVLGPFGYGKTFLLRQLARAMHQQAHRVVPVIVQLRDLKEVAQVETLVARQLSDDGEGPVDLDDLRNLLREGYVALLFDGYDELATRVGWEQAAEQLRTFANVAQDRCKIVLTGRDHYFLTDDEVLMGLGGRLLTVAGRRVVRLTEFDETQILDFLRYRLGSDSAARERLRLLQNVENLAELARNPRMLDFIARIDELHLRNAGGSRAKAAARLYREVLHQWLDGERSRLSHTEPADLPTLQQLWQTVTDLAARMWRSGEQSIGLEDLDESVDGLARRLMDQASGHGAREFAGVRADASHLIGTSTLLMRDGQSRFWFVHRSVMEWLVASHIHDLLAAGDPLPWPLRDEVSDLMINFVCGLDEQGAALRWAVAVRQDEQCPAGASINALNMLKIFGVDPLGAARLAGKDLRAEDLSGQQLANADLSGANLAEVILNFADLSGANLDEANLVRARLNEASLRNATLRGADLTGARLLGADLTGADLDHAIVRRAALVGARLDEQALAHHDLAGTVLPHHGPARPQFRPSRIRTAAVAIDHACGLIVAGGSDGTLRLWDSGSFELIRLLAGHTGPIWSVALHAHKALLASSGQDGRIRLWNTGDGQLNHVLDHGGGPVRSVAFAPDGATMVSGGNDGTVARWDTATGARLGTFTGGARSLWSVTYSPGIIAACSADATVRLWSADTGEPLHQLTSEQATIWSLAFGADGEILFSGGNDASVHAWQARTAQWLYTVTGGSGPVWSLATSPGGMMAAGYADGVACVWDSADGQLRHRLTGHDGPVWAVAFDPTNNWLVTDDGTVRIWDLHTGDLLRNLTGSNHATTTLSFAGKGTLASAGDDGVIRLWDPGRGTRLRHLPGHTRPGRTSPVRAVALSGDGRWMASATDLVQVTDITGGSDVRNFSDYVGPVRALAFSPDTRHLASGCDTVRITEFQTKNVIRELPGHAGSVRALAYSPDGTQIASGGDDDEVRIWDAHKGTLMHTMSGHIGSVQALAYCPNGRELASASDHIRLWDTRRGQLRADIAAYGSAVRAVAYSPDGMLLASAGDDAVVRLWDAGNGRLIRELDGGSGSAWAVAFLGATRLASSGDDGTIRVWDCRTGSCELIMLALSDTGWAALAGDGRYKIDGVATGEFWYSIAMCRFEPGELDDYLPAIQRVALSVPLP
jgi:WD40 repeat protein